jgi:hypothetical protein
MGENKRAGVSHIPISRPLQYSNKNPGVTEQEVKAAIWAAKESAKEYEKSDICYVEERIPGTHMTYVSVCGVCCV